MKVFQFLTVIIIMLISTTTFAQEKEKKTVEEKVKEKSKEKADELHKELELSHDQYQKVVFVYSDYYTKKYELEEKINEIEKELKQLKKERGTKIVGILNTEQKEQLVSQNAKSKKRKKKN